jgi:transcriptional regulator with XRE-family HTH domain
MSTHEALGAIPRWTRADRLVKAREHAGLSQTELAAQLDVSVRSIKRYEAGAQIRRGLLLGWGFACGVDPIWLELGVTPTGYGDGNTGTDDTGVTIRDLFTCNALLAA